MCCKIKLLDNTKLYYGIRFCNLKLQEGIIRTGKIRQILN